MRINRKVGAHIRVSKGIYGSAVISASALTLTGFSDTAGKDGSTCVKPGA